MEALQALRVLHNRLLVVLCGSAPVPYEGLYIEALRPQGAVQWSQVGSMGS